MKEISKYQCEVCHTIYDSPREAKLCELAPVIPCPFEIGKKYYHTIYKRSGILKSILFLLPPSMLHENIIGDVSHGYGLLFDSQIVDSDHLDQEMVGYYGLGLYKHHMYTKDKSGLPDYFIQVV